jgi:hypothetical protein
MNRREALAALVSMPEIARISKAAVAPTDVIVVEVPGKISMEHAKNLMDQLQQIWPEPQRIVILEDGITIKVL